MSLFSLSTPHAGQPNPHNEILQVVETGRGDAVQVIHESVLQMARNPVLLSKIDSTIGKLKAYSFRNFNGKGKYLSVQYAERAIFLLRLLKDSDLALWKTTLVSEEALADLREFNSFGTMGYLLTMLPAEKKQVLLTFLGATYNSGKNRAVLQPIHLLLDPKVHYDAFKSAGRSDREFYVHYLSLIKARVFPQSEVGSYSAETVLRLVEIIQKQAIHDGILGVNFFGSVPNGFGKAQSDLDIFTSHLTPEELAQYNIYPPKASDQSAERLHRVLDPQLQMKIGEFLKGSPWSWYIENKDVHPWEHFGGTRHVFSFHITQQRIILRFYYQKLQWDERARPVELEYLELDISEK